MDLAELLQWVTLGRKTGSLAFIRNKVKNSIFFREGRIISSKSNEPNKQLGHFLLFQGKINELQLKKALESQLQTRTMLGRILVQEEFVSRQEVERALISRTEEVIYDLFLWEDGYFHFTVDGYNLDELFVINIDVNAIIFEGVRRKDEWARIRQVFPSNEVVLRLCPDVDLKSLQLTPIQKKLLFLITLGKPISEIILELHGSDFLVNYELFQIYDRGVIEVVEVRPGTMPAEDTARLFSRGLELMEKRQYQDAIAAFQEILRLDPQNASADEKIEQAEKALCQEYYRNTIPPGKVPYVVVQEHDLARHSLTHQEDYVVSRVNGTWDIKSIIMLSPLREIETLQVLEKLTKMNLIALR